MVTLNEAALRFMLEDEAGPIGRMLSRVVDGIAGKEEAVVNMVFAKNPEVKPRVVDQVISGEDGLVGVVDIPFDGNVSYYFAQKMGREDWIVETIMQDWYSQIGVF